MMRWIGPVMLAGFVAASAWSLRLGYADFLLQKGTPAAVEAAIRATPGREEYYLRLAVLESTMDGGKALQALQHAAALNGSDARAWIELGLACERAGKQDLAERSLLRAAQEDKQYLPRWTLTNYYFRRENMERFWFWATEAAAVVPGDPTPLFRLCGQAGDDGNLIERLKIGQPEVRARYLAYLLNQGATELIGRASGSLLRSPRKEHVPILLEACDRLLEANRVGQAAAIWRALGSAGALPLGLGKPGTADVVTNGSFAVPPTAHGFDWRLAVTDGVSAAWEPSPSGLRLTFSGREPENCAPLVQFAPVEENARYEMVVRYRTRGIPADAGLRWTVEDMESRVLAQGKSLSSDQDALQRFAFQVPAGCDLLRLAVKYVRSPGTMRIEGFVRLESVQVGKVR
jgi:tetratricopeptide (TPR) repeat protein